MGYVAGDMVPTTTIVAGVWQQTPAQDVVSAAPLPGWDELRFTDAGTDYALSSGTVSNWTQTVDMHTGAISTSLDWTSPAGHATHLAYDVLADLAQPNVATVRLRLTPAWSGSARVTDVLGSGASTDLVPVSSTSFPGHRLVTLAVRTQGTGVTVAYASRLGFTAKPLAMTAAHGSPDASLAVDFAVQAGKTYEFTKAVGIATSQDSSDHERRPTPSRQAPTPPGLTGFSRSPSARGPTAGRATSCCPTIPRCSARSARRSSTSRRAFDRARTGASPRWGCRRAATTTTSSGMPRRGCTRRCSSCIRTWRRASSTTGPTRLPAPAPTRRPRVIGGRGTRGRARTTAPSRRRPGRRRASSS